MNLISNQRLLTLKSCAVKGPKGETGNTGATGETGPAGTSAYEAAVSGGYAGSELNFNSMLANYYIPTDSLSDKTTKTLPASVIVSGGLSAETGAETTSSKRCRTKYYIPTKTAAISIPDGIKVSFRFYAQDKTFLSSTDFFTASEAAMKTIMTSEAPLFKATMGYVSGANVETLAEFENIVIAQTNEASDFNGSFVLPELLNGNASENYLSTLFVPVKAGDCVYFDVWVKGSATFFAVFDSDGTRIDALTGSSGKSRFKDFYTVTQNGYVRAMSMSPTNPLYEAAGSIKIMADDNAKPAQKLDEIEKSSVSINSQNNDFPVLSILAAKYFSYHNGSPAVIDWYLLIDPKTNRFYMSKDLKHKKYIFTFSGDNNNPHRYKYGILPNGDIIAVYRCEFETRGASYGPELDNVRKNPYVFLASENYQAKHVVDFGTFNPVTQEGLKPSGWLQNVGFCVLPDKSVVFCEYTREMVLYTANCWKIEADADITDPSNWTVIKQFLVAPNDTDELNESYIEHFHAAQWDSFGETLYITTGDLGNKSQIWYSKDYGETFTQQRFLKNGEYVTSGQKEFRLVNFTFTDQYAYWISDTSSSQRGVMRCARNQNGGLDEDSLTELLNIPATSPGYPATYGQAYLPEFNLLVLMERCDETGASSMAFRAFDMTTNTLKTITTLRMIDGGSSGDIHSHLGFRTEYTEYDPEDGIIKCGFGGRWEYRNRNDLFDNVISTEWKDMINNLNVRVWRDSNGNIGCRFGVYYL